MFKFLKNIFSSNKNSSKSKNNLMDEDGNVLHESSIEYNKGNQRFLRLTDDSCAIVIHGDNNVEVVFTKSYDPENQTITQNEEELMALALFMKKEGFLEMIIDEFRKIAKNNIKNLTKDDENK